MDAQGRRIAGFGTSVFNELTGGRFVTLQRSELARAVLECAQLHSEIMFGDSISGLQQEGSCVAVTFEHAPARSFDFVVGADGLHSRVRELVFGPESRFEHHLGYTVAAFECQGYRPRDENVYVMYNEPGRMVGRVALRDDVTLFLFVFVDRVHEAKLGTNLAGRKELLRQHYDGGGWETARILDALDAAKDLYFDDVSQIVMPRWSNGRIGLVGDAAFCVSLTAGQGTALAMTAAFVMAGEFGRADVSPQLAFQCYEDRLRAFIESKQRAAKVFSAALAPKTAYGLRFRDLVTSAAGAVPGLAKLTFGRDLIDTLKLPPYAWH